jgi:carbon-monoxide dehydrogenase iron sulfur subunit
MNTVMVKPERCIGCRHCEIACAIEHSQSKTLFGAVAEDPIPKPRIHVEVGPGLLTFPNRCQHCDPAPCLQVCPTSALSRDAETDSVIVDYNKCIACGACAMVCPFGIIQFEKTWQVALDRNVNTKCDHCIDRQREGRIPACVEACKTGALEFGDINDLIRTTRKDFTFKILSPSGGETEVPEIPENIRAFRDIMKKITEIGIFQE